MQIQWHDIDPETNSRRYIHAERFAGVWSFKTRAHRRDDWTKDFQPTRVVWEHVLKSLELRLPRREGVLDEDVAQVAKILKELIALEDRRRG